MSAATRTIRTGAREAGTLPAMSPLLRIGDVAQASGVSVDTLRFYERRGLLRPAGRRSSGYREYAPETVRLVRFIRRAQSLGFTLAEVEELVRLREQAWTGSGPAHLREAAGAKMQEIDRRVRELQALRGALGRLITACDRACASPPTAVTSRREKERTLEGRLDCPLVEALEDVATLDAGMVTRNDTASGPPAPGRMVPRKKGTPASRSSSTRRRP